MTNGRPQYAQRRRFPFAQVFVTERAARKAMEQIEAPFLRERETHPLTNQLLDVVKQLGSSTVLAGSERILRKTPR